MNCTDCNGSGKYQPLIGPAEPCHRCSGNGLELRHYLAMAKVTRNGMCAGDWHLFNSHDPLGHWKPIVRWPMVEVRYLGHRLLTLDTGFVCPELELEIERDYTQPYHCFWDCWDDILKQIAQEICIRGGRWMLKSDKTDNQYLRQPSAYRVGD